MAEPHSALGYAGALSSLGLFAGRVTGSVVGRPVELAAAEQELATARSRVACLTLEGEPGIGKTRILLAIEELARAQSFVSIAVTAEEEIRGPFLVARSIFASPAAAEAAEAAGAEPALQGVLDALSNNDDPGLERLTPDRKLLRVFDLAAVALRAIAAKQPLAVIVDDLQWADEDSLRMLRYVIRADAASPICFVLAMRGDEVAFVNEAVTLLADMERMGMRRRLKLGRFSQLQSSEFLQQILGGRINATSAAVMHAQAEGVPFVLAEQAHAYRDAGLVQQIDGVWTLARNAERMLPSAVKTLIQRRAARLPDDTRASLAEAAILGRSFSLRDLRDLKARLGEEAPEVQLLAQSLAPAVDSGLLVQLPDGSSADYSFTHDQIRQYATAALTPPRRRAIHAAIVEMLIGTSGPAPGSEPLVAAHALASGQADLCARASIDAAGAAIKAHAPEEALRLVDLAHPVASSPQHRVALLRLRDDALDMLRHPAQRLEGLAELAALAEALGDTHLELEVLLRRAAALRLSQEHEAAAELARRVRRLAGDGSDTAAELAACLELGQDLFRAEIGEGYTQTPTEADLDGAAEAFQCAADLAEELKEEATLAAATRELGIIAVSRVRIWFISAFSAGELDQVMQRVAAGERLEDIMPTLSVAPLAMEAGEYFRRALDIYERLGDRQGAMSTIIAMAFVTWGPEIHMGGSAKRIEELHRLMSRMKSFTKESERALAEAQVLFGAHVYSRAKIFPDTAIVKGEEAFTAARNLGDRSLEFASAGGIAMVHAGLGATDEAERWLGRAAAVASAEPTPLRSLQLESWRGAVRAAAGDASGMRQHMERAIQIASDQGRPAARCEALAQLALGAARLGAEANDAEMLDLAQRTATEAKALVPILPGQPLWGAQADAALARVHVARGDSKAAAEAGRAALATLAAAMLEDPFLDIVLPAAEGILAAGSEDEKAAVIGQLRLTLRLIAQHILNEDVRVRWFRSVTGRDLRRLAGGIDAPDLGATAATGAVALSEADTVLLRLLTEGRTNREIGEELGASEESVSRQLAEIFVKIGASSRAEATATALMGKLV